jgi:hypothetical protein
MGKNDGAVKITSWKQLKEKKKTGFVELTFPDKSIVEIEIQGLSQGTIDVINEKYEVKKESRPRIQNRVNGKVAGYIDAPEDSDEYLEWQKKNQVIDSLKMAELALAFMVVKPDGETFEAQIKELKDELLAGHFIQIIQSGYNVSGFDIGDKIDQAKN